MPSCRELVYSENDALHIVSFSLYSRSMGLLDRASELLRRTEAELRKIVSDAATAGDYASVVQVAAWARSLNEMLDRFSPRKGKTGEDHASPDAGSRRREPRASRNNRTRSPTNHGGYPRFFRQGDRLVRVAWSKREKREYEHKAPLAVLKALTVAMASKGADGRVFSTDDLLPIHDDDGAEVPAYQAYAGLALFKQVGLIEQHGRQGYSIPRLPELSGAVEAVLRSLPERQG